MPNIYTHYKFGNLVKNKLNTNLQEIINNNEKFFILGQQGPDIFFFNPDLWGKEEEPGNIIHKSRGAEFIYSNRSLLLSKKDDDRYLAYFLGSLCHYILDSKIHPLVNSLSTLEFTHIDVEVELDRFFMVEDGLNPKTYPVENLIPKGNDIYEVVAPFYSSYPLATYENVKKGINYFHFFKKILKTPNKGKENFLKRSMDILKVNKSYKSQIMKTEPLKLANVTNPILEEKYYAIVEKAPKLIGRAYSAIYDYESLSKTFNRNYNGVKKGVKFEQQSNLT